jgi:ATP-dependent helicase/nuclease subunit A
MQALPDIAPERRREAGLQYLKRTANEFSAAERQTILDQVLKLIADQRFAPLFAPGSRAEVPIVGRLPRGNLPPLVVSGQIDRLAVIERTVLVADYKTNRPAPRCLAEVPPAYVTQLALYRAVLGRVYPDRTVRAALVWTDVPDLMELSAADLEQALIPLMRR